MSENFKVTLSHWQNAQFLVDFHQDGVPDLLTDEPVPIGDGAGPNPARLLAAAVGNCLAASLHFCLRKAHIAVEDVYCVVEGEMTRNEKGRLRITELRVKVEPRVDPADLDRSARCIDIFENFCVVTESVRSGIDVIVELAPFAAQEPAAV